jgi:hypothetical protein
MENFINRCVGLTNLTVMVSCNVRFLTVEEGSKAPFSFIFRGQGGVKTAVL